MSEATKHLSFSLFELFDAFPLPVLATDAGGRIAYANLPLAELLGASGPDSLLGTSADRFLLRGAARPGTLASPDEDALVRRPDDRLIRVHVVTGRIPLESGEARWMLLRARPECPPPDGLDASLGVSADALASRVGHELANLLTPMLGYVELQRMTEGAEPGGMLDTFLNISRRMQIHVQNLLMLRDRGEPLLRPVPLGDTIAKGRLWAEETGLLRPHRLEIAPVDPSVQVQVEADMVSQAIANLLVNAAEAMREPGMITLAVRPLGVERVELRISDSGPGPAPDVAQRLFAPLFSTKSNGKGIGLGLFVAKRIVIRQKGSIHLEPNSPHGLTAIIRLPLLPTR